MRRNPGSVVLLLLILVACAETPSRPSATVAVATPTAAVLPSATVPTTGPLAIEPARAAVASPTPAVTESPWPAFLRELDFSVPAGNSYNPRALAVHSSLGRLYARTHTQGFDALGQIVMMDLASGQVLAVVETGPDSFSEGALVVDTALDRIYALNPGDTTCSVLDAETLEPIATLDRVERLALDVEGGRLYVGDPAGLRVLDAVEYKPLGELPLPSAQRFPALAVDPALGRIYLAIQDASGYSLCLCDAATLQMGVPITLPGQPDALLANPARGELYMTLNDGAQSLLWRLDSDGRLVEQRPLGEWTQKTHLALDLEGSRLFLGREIYGDYGITILDLQTGRELGDIPLDRAPNALVWDGKSGRLLVSHTYANRIGVVDSETMRVSGAYPTAVELVDLAVDPDRGHLYITDTAGRLHVLDGETDEELAVLPGEGRISVDSPHGRLYTGGEGANRVRILDSNRLEPTGEIHTNARPVADAYHGDLYLVRSGVYLADLETMTTTAVISDTLPQNPGFSPNPAAVDAVVDPGSGRLFAIINNGVPGSNGGTYLYVYEPESYQKVLTDTERSPVYLDVDPGTGRAYVSRIHMTQRSTSLLADGHDYAARLEGVFGALRVDPALGRVYITIYDDHQGQMLVLDAENLDVLGSVPIPGGFALRALDPQRHLLYLAAVDGQVQIWSATGGDLAPAAEPAPADLAAEGAYRLLLPPDQDPLFALDKQYRLYRSDDGGSSWGLVGGGLPEEWVLDLVFSPDFEQDRTLFAALATADQGFGVWKSADGGKGWRMVSTGLTDLTVTDLAISPTFSADHTLFATARRGGLFRSTNGGETWASLTERYRPQDSYSQQPGAVTLSPTYGQDQTLYVSHYGLQRSTDGGETWTTLVPEISHLALSPSFATDHTLYGWAGSGGVLRSTDGGDAWQAVGVGLVLQGYGSGRVLVSPDYAASQSVYFVWTPSQPDMPVQVFRSTDSATTWERLPGELAQASTPLELAADGSALVALDSRGRLVRWPVSGLNWEPASLPPVDEIAIYHLMLSPGFAQDQTLFALSEEAGILRSSDAGLTWVDTGFPVRVTFGDPPELLIVPPDTLFVGTALGLYRSVGDGQWAAVGGRLPQGVGISSPAVGADGSLRVLVDRKRVYLSTDGGQTWIQPIPDLPYPVHRDDPLFSPAFATDHTTYLGISWEKPQRTFGNRWEEFGPPGEWNLSGLYLSPTFDQDGLVLLQLGDNSLWRSTDQGNTWTEIRGPWEDSFWIDVTFSTAYAKDAGLFARTDGPLYRSTDQGTTWTKVLDLLPRATQLRFAADYVHSAVIYLLQGHTLYHSTDRGQTWKTLPPAPWDEYDEITLQLSPTWSQDSTLLAWIGSGQVYQSSDGGQSWRDVSSGLPAVAIRQILFSPGYAADGLVYLVPQDGGLYKRRGESSWIPVTEAELPPSPRVMPTATSPRPAPTPVPVACATEPVRFLAVWNQARERLGCPQQSAEQVLLAEQPFERGRMIWDSASVKIYVMLEAGTWQAFDDTFVEGVDPAYDPSLPPPPQQPQRGFGKVWREQLGGPQAAIGWAVGDERPVDGWRQRFEQGWLVWTDAIQAGTDSAGTAYLLYKDGTWQAIPLPGS